METYCTKNKNELDIIRAQVKFSFKLLNKDERLNNEEIYSMISSNYTHGAITPKIVENILNDRLLNLDHYMIRDLKEVQIFEVGHSWYCNGFEHVHCKPKVVINGVLTRLPIESVPCDCEYDPVLCDCDYACDCDCNKKYGLKVEELPEQVREYFFIPV